MPRVMRVKLSIVISRRPFSPELKTVSFPINSVECRKCETERFATIVSKTFPQVPKSLHESNAIRIDTIVSYLDTNVAKPSVTIAFFSYLSQSESVS